MKYLILISLLTIGCAPKKCQIKNIPFYFTDGTVTYWHYTICYK